MSNVLPNGWSVSTLSQLSEVITKGTTPTTNGFSYMSKGVNFLRVENISNGGKIIESDLKFISDEAHASLRRSQLREGDLLISIAGAIGRSAIVEKKHLPANTNQAVGIVRLLNGAIENKYIRFAFESPIVEEQINNLQSGMAQINLNLEQLGSLRINLPPLIEQKKIASILTTVDEVIESTTAQINKLKDLKTGMMQELLTKGIGHTEFKDSPVGRIPKAWEVVKTGQVTKSIVPGRNKPKQLEGDIPWITISDIDEVYISKSKNNFGVSRIVLAEASGKTVPKDAVVMTVVGEFGISAVAACELVLNQQLHAFVCSEKIFPMYLCLILRFQKTQLEKLATQTTIAYMNKENTESLLIPLPSVVEQKKITEAVLSIESSMVKKTSRLNALCASKKALMQDLLTGKVRVD